MKPSTPKTEPSLSTQLRKEVFGSFLKTMCSGFALGLAFLTATAFADVVGYFKFDNFSGDNGAFTDDAGKGLRGLLGFPFSAPLSVPGPSGQAGDLAVSLDGSGGLAADDSPAQLLNFLTPPLTLECWVRSTNDLQIGRHRAFMFAHYMGNKLVTFATNVLYNTMLTDMETCYKAMRIEVLRSMRLKSNGFGIEPEITAKIFKRGYRVYEVPITYAGRGYEQGKKITWRAGFGALCVLLKYRFTE